MEKIYFEIYFSFLEKHFGGRNFWRNIFQNKFSPRKKIFFIFSFCYHQCLGISFPTQPIRSGLEHFNSFCTILKLKIPENHEKTRMSRFFGIDLHLYLYSLSSAFVRASLWALRTARSGSRPSSSPIARNRLARINVFGLELLQEISYAWYVITFLQHIIYVDTRVFK